MKRGACGPRVGMGARLAEDDSLGDMRVVAGLRPVFGRSWRASLKTGHYNPPNSRARCAGL